jgi:hypothetical protein
MERGEQRAGLYLEGSARDLLDATGNAETMHFFERQYAKDEEIEGALEETGGRHRFLKRLYRSLV